MTNIPTTHHLCIGNHIDEKHSWDDIYYMLVELDERIKRVEGFGITGGFNYDPETENLTLGYEIEREVKKMSSEKCFCHLNGYQVKDAVDRIERSETEFKTISILKAQEHGLHMIAIEDFKTTAAIDNVDNGASVISNYYEADKHQIAIPSGVSATIRSKAITSKKIVKKVFIEADYEGTGSIVFSFSVDGGNNFINITEKQLTEISAKGTNLVVKVTISGGLKLKNLFWGVRY